MTTAAVSLQIQTETKVGVYVYGYTGAGTTIIIALYCMGCIWYFGRGLLTSHCGVSAGGLSTRPHTSGYLQTAYIHNIHPACWLPALHMHSGKDLVWSVTETLDSSLWQTQQPYCLYPHLKPSQLWTHQRKPTYVRICECGLLARYHNLRNSIDFVLSRTGYITCLWDTAQTEPRHPRHGTASRSSSTCGFTPYRV